MIYSNKGLCSEAFKAYDVRFIILVAVVFCSRETHSHSPSLKRVTTSDIAVSPSYPPHLQHEYFCHPLHQTLPQARQPHRVFQTKPITFFPQNTSTISLEVLAPAPSLPWEPLLRATTTFTSTLLKFIQTSAITSLASLEMHPIKLESSAASTSTRMLLDSSRYW